MPGIRIVTSPRRRAVQTATAIAAVIGSASIERDERWAETDFGIAEGLSFDELALVAPEMAAQLVAGDVDIDWPGGEPAASLRTRIEAAWRDVVGDTRAALDSAGALVVTHGGPMRVAIALATGLPGPQVSVPEPAGVWRLGPDAPGGPWPETRTA